MKRAQWGILLGCRSRKDGSLSGSQKRRSDLAIACYQKGLYQNLLICGGNTGGVKSESEAMADYIRSRANIPITLEKTSLNTWQNFEEAYKIIGNSSILILTSQSHTFRSKLIAGHYFDQISAKGARETHARHWLREAGSLGLYFFLELKKRLKNRDY